MCIKNRPIKVTFLSILLNIALLLISTNLFSAQISSNGTGGGSWNSTSTWTGLTVPSATDTVIILAGDAVTLDVSPSILRLIFEGGATANSLIHDGYSLTISGDVVMDGPTANNQAQQWLINTGVASITGNLTMNVTGTANTRTTTVTVTTGTLSFDSLIYTSTDGFDNRSRIEITGAGVINMNGDIDLVGNNGALDCGSSGRFNFTGTDDQILKQTGAGSILFHDVYIQGGSGRSVFVDANINQGGGEQVTGSIYVESGTLDAQDYIISLPGETFSVSDGASFATQEPGADAFPTAGTISLAANSTVIYNGASNQTISAETYGNLSIINTNLTSNRTFTMAGNITVNGDLTLSSENGPLTIYDISATTITASGTGTFNMGANTRLELAGASNFPDSFGSFSFDSGSEVQYEASAVDQTIASSSSTTSNVISYAVLDIRNGLGAGYAKNPNGPLTVAGDFQVGPGGNNVTLNLGSYNHTIGGNWVDGGSTINTGTSTITFNGADQSISSGTFSDIVFTGSGTKTVSTSLTVDSVVAENGVGIDINGSITINEAFDAGTSSILISGNWTNPGVLTAGTSTVTFDGGDSDILSDEVFYNLILNSTGGANALDFGTAATPVSVTVNNDFTVTNGEVRIRSLAGTELAVAGDLSIENNTAAGISFLGADITIETGGDFLNNNVLGGVDDGLTSLDGTEVFTFNGSGSNTFRHNVTTDLGNIVIDKAGGEIDLDGALTLTGSLTLTNGLFNTDGTNLLTMDATASVIGGSSSSYVNGPMVHTFSTAGVKSYPIGKASAYRPVELNLTSVASSPEVQAEMFDGSSDGDTDTTTMDTISIVRYYRTEVVNAGTISAGTVKLTAGSDDGLTDLNTTVIAQSTTQSGTYTSIGRSASTGTATNGTVTSDSYDFNEAADYFLFGYELTVPTQLTIISISPNPIVLDEDFSVTIQSQNGTGSPSNVSQDTPILLRRVVTGSHLLSGDTTGIILNEQNEVTITGVQYDTTENIQIEVSRTGGDLLTADTSAVISVASAFYSITSGDPATLSNWDDARDGSGDPPGALVGLFIVQDTHTMMTTANFNEADVDLRIEYGGTFVNNVGTMDIGDLIIESGGLVRANTEIEVAATAVFNILSGGEYIHNNTIPLDQAQGLFAGTEIFENGSIFTVLQLSPDNSSLNAFASATYGNLTLNMTSITASESFNGNLTEIANDFTILSIGTGRIELADGAGEEFTLNIGEDFTISNGTLFVLDGAATTATINVGGTVSLSGGELRMTDGSGDPILNASGTVSITGGTLTMSATNGGNSTINLSGNYTHTAGTVTETAGGSGTFVFNGSSAQTWTAGGTLGGDNLNYTINNSAGLTLAGSSATISGALTLTNGDFNTSSSYYVTIASGGSVSGGSANSFVDGPMAHTWTTATETKKFAIGDDTAYRPLDLTLTTPTSPVINAQVFNQNPGGTPQEPLENISQVRYYQTTIESGSVANGTVRLTWGPDDGIEDIPNMVVARSTGPVSGDYYSIGQSGSSGDTESGSVTSATYAPSSTDYIVLGTTNSDVSLPVELSLFSAEVVENKVRLTWRTESEIDNINWVVERATSSADGDNGLVDFEKIATLPGQGTIAEATDYEYIDEEIKGGERYIYRIADVSYKGVITYHENISVFVELPKIYELFQNYPNPFNPTTNIKFSIPTDARIQINVYNTLGQKINVLLDDIMDAGYHTIQWNGINNTGRKVPSGVYFIHLAAEGLKTNQQFTRVIKVILLK